MIMLSVLKLFRSPSSFRSIRILSKEVSDVSSGVVRRTPPPVSPIEEEFNQSHKTLATLREPRRDVKIQLYALFQQATLGACHVAKPDILDFNSFAKWDAWRQLRAMTQEDAKTRYVELVKSLEAATGVSRSSAQQAAEQEEWSDHLRVSKDGHVMYIRFNRPAKKNAITLLMYDEISLILENATQDKEVYIVVFTGTGDYYCSGNDLSNFTRIHPESIEAQTKEIKSIIKNFVLSFIDFPKPLVALVNGPALGIAVSLLGLFDAVYAVETATFQTPFMQLGQSPVACSSYIFPKIMGAAKAGEMLMFNRKLTAQGALDRNLVTQVFSEDVFHRETEALVADFATLPPQGMLVTKKLLKNAEREKLHKVNEEECESLLERWKSEECWLAIMAAIKQNKMDDV